jgi:glycosyltransferase involved in cell wall biosynthesis
VRRLGVDIVHLQYEGFGFHQSFFLPFFLQAVGKRRVHTLHEVWFTHALHRARDRYLYSLADHLIVNDQGCFERLQALHPRPPITKVGVGMNIPVQETKFQEISERLVQIGYFGFFNKIKRVDFLLETVKELRESTNIPFELQMIGEFEPNSTPYHRELLALRDRLGLEKVAHFTGALPADEVSKRLGSCHMAVLPFIDGASPRRGSFQACMGLGVPTITTRSEYVERDIVDRETALLIENPEKNSIKRAIMELAKDRDLRQRLRTGALAFHAKFTWDAVADKHMQIYQSLLAN